MITSNTILQNRYLILRQLGQGGMGTVYEALDQRVNCIVALKETLAMNEGEARRAFEREASLLANLHHSALPKVMDYFTESDGDFLVMEFIPGYDLAELLELRGSPFPQAQVLRWADDLLKVLEYLHGRTPPILHRDIKPSNLKLTKQGEIFLLDFGLAKGAAGQMPTLMTSRSVRGYTPVYAPLEQIHGQGTDPRSDIYCLGATLYHLSTGSPPIDAPTRFNTIEEEHPDPLRPIEKLNPQFSSNIAAVIHQALAVSRRQRPASAAEMRKALRHAAEEDERRAGEEEYLRAEANRGQREEEAARAAEEERQRQEEETRKLAEERSREAEQRRLEDEAARRAEAERERQRGVERQRQKAEEEEDARRAEAERRQEAEERARAEEEANRRRANVPKTVAAPTVRAEERPPTGDAKSQPGIKTVKTPPAEMFVPDHRGESSGTASVGGSGAIGVAGGKRTVMIVVGVVALIIVGVMIFYLTSGTGSQNANRNKAGETPPQAGSQINTNKTGASPRQTALNIEMVYVQGGTFMMGSPSGQGYDEERPLHQVIVAAFYMGKYEVTQAQWTAVMDNNPSNFKGCDQCPVENVSWDDTQEFIRRLNEMQNQYSYRLPTEAEWEYAARAGTTGDYAGNLDSMAWYDENSGNKTHPVGQKQPNAWGLYDMHGNVWEWVQDWYGTYPSGEATNPQGPGSGSYRVDRGGSWRHPAALCRSAHRDDGSPGSRYGNLGFRLVRTLR